MVLLIEEVSVALSPQEALAFRNVPTAQNQADYLVTQIDAWLAREWREPNRTCFEVPTHLKSHPWYDEMLKLVLAKYRPTWPSIYITKVVAKYYCDFIAFITKPNKVTT